MPLPYLKDQHFMLKKRILTKIYFL